MIRDLCSVVIYALCSVICYLWSVIYDLCSCTWAWVLMEDWLLLLLVVLVLVVSVSLRPRT